MTTKASVLLNTVCAFVLATNAALTADEMVVLPVVGRAG